MLVVKRWPGNVRELQNTLRYALIKCKGEVLRPEHLPPLFAAPGLDGSIVKWHKPKISADSAATALACAGRNPVAASRSLGVSRATLYRHLPRAEKRGGASPNRDALPAANAPASRSRDDFDLLEQRLVEDHPLYEFKPTTVTAKQAQRLAGSTMLPR